MLLLASAGGWPGVAVPTVIVVLPAGGSRGDVGAVDGTEARDGAGMNSTRPWRGGDDDRTTVRGGGEVLMSTLRGRTESASVCVPAVVAVCSEGQGNVHQRVRVHPFLSQQHRVFGCVSRRT